MRLSCRWGELRGRASDDPARSTARLATAEQVPAARRGVTGLRETAGRGAASKAGLTNLWVGSRLRFSRHRHQLGQV